MRGLRGQVVISLTWIYHLTYLQVWQIPINELCCWQGDRGPKGLNGLKGAAGFKVNTPRGTTFNSICIIRKQQAAIRGDTGSCWRGCQRNRLTYDVFQSSSAALQPIKWDKHVFSDSNRRVFVVHLEELEKLGNKEKLWVSLHTDCWAFCAIHPWLTLRPPPRALKVTWDTKEYPDLKESRYTYFLPPWTVSSSSIGSLKLTRCYFQGEKGTAGVIGREGPRGKQVGYCWRAPKNNSGIIKRRKKSFHVTTESHWPAAVCMYVLSP